MKKFSALIDATEQTQRSVEKVALILEYFRTVPPEDAAWALALLTGRALPRILSLKLLQDVAVEASGLPKWLIEESLEAAGDVAEGIALLVSPRVSSRDSSRVSSRDSSRVSSRDFSRPVPEAGLPLHRLVHERVLPLKELSDAERRALIVKTWRELSAEQAFLWNKFLTGGINSLIAEKLIVRALAQLAAISEEAMTYRLSRDWAPSAESFNSILQPADRDAELAKPFGFCLAAGLTSSPSKLGSLAAWQVENRWEGLRVQLIRRGSEVLLWSHGEELVTECFPEISEFGEALSEPVVLDGLVIPWSDGQPLAIESLAKRLKRVGLARKRIDAKTRAESPVVFMAADLLEASGVDLRMQPLADRRRRLEELHARHAQMTSFLLSEILQPVNWPAVEDLKNGARERGATGVTLKRLDSTYRVESSPGQECWWELACEPFYLDAVLMYAERAQGQRGSQLSLLTLGVWNAGQLVPVAKVRPNLEQREIAELEQFVRKNTLERFGPVRTVQPELVFELAFEGLQESKRNKAGFALRAPRLNRWRRDRSASGVETVQTLQALFAEPGRP